MKLKSLWKMFSPIIDMALSIGLVGFSIYAIIYMYVMDAYSFWLMVTLCSALYGSVRGLVGNLFKPNE
ncbi:hypothetical protein AC739_12850 [Planococcus glaciei]|nr:hypothetical protein G159_13775 [Planococcus glaciei CHR43]KOF09809.1 hypothetical protein AC739_12850 [Planococcus glaciei]MCP2034657.1 hypothetical protein [Planomicrobium sp. HSC-17F08]SDH83718.1 hypothetical protein SAMN04487975_108135 [Planococcus glaciei]